LPSGEGVNFILLQKLVLLDCRLIEKGTNNLSIGAIDQFNIQQISLLVSFFPLLDAMFFSDSHFDDPAKLTWSQRCDRGVVWLKLRKMSLLGTRFRFLNFNWLL
jgi:hypothetical protein